MTVRDILCFVVGFTAALIGVRPVISAMRKEIRDLSKSVETHLFLMEEMIMND